MPLPWPFISVPTGLTAGTCTLVVYLFCHRAFFGFQSLVVPAHGSWEVPRNLHPSRAVPKRGLTGVGVLVAKLLCHWVSKGKVRIYTGFQRSLVGLSSVTWWYSLTGCLLFPCSLSYSPTVRHLANVLLTLTSLSLSLLLGKPDLKTACIADDNLMLRLPEVLLSSGFSKAFLWNCVSLSAEKKAELWEEQVMLSGDGKIWDTIEQEVFPTSI